VGVAPVAPAPPPQPNGVPRPKYLARPASGNFFKILVTNLVADPGEATSFDGKSQSLENPSVPLHGLLIRDREYIEFETWKKQC
jgi:hypothetical protein